MLGLSLVLGVLMGAGFGGLNEFNERFFRTGEEVRDRVGLKFLGYLPTIGSRPAKDESRPRLSRMPRQPDRRRPLKGGRECG